MADVRFHHQDPEMKGWLYKWTNYLKGYQKRWFVLSNGLLSYYRNQAEMAHTCRGTISLVSAVFHTEDSCNFVISNGGTQTFHLRAISEVERQKWVTALELAKARAIRVLDSEDDDDYGGRDINTDRQELQSMMKGVLGKMEDLRTCHDLMVKQGSALQRSLTELEQVENPSEALSKAKSVNERATLFRITSNAMLNASSEYLTLAQTHGKKWQKLLVHEHETRLKLEEMVEQLAKQHSHLEARASIVQNSSSANPSSSGSASGSASGLSMGKSVKSVNSPNSDDEEFFDAEENAADFYVSFPGKAHRITQNNSNPGSVQRRSRSSTLVEDDEASSGSDASDSGDTQFGVRRESTSRKKRHQLNKNSSKDSVNYSGDPTDHPEAGTSGRSSSLSSNRPIDNLDRLSIAINPSGRVRRTRIPEKPNQSLNLWSFMKNCIGKELTKIPMPVNFNEPLSMLQRITEDLEYAELLHKAAKIKDPCEQLTYVAAFCVSNNSTMSDRTGKPFNPLLGETFECDRTQDLGWKSITEQVSHHPPMLAMHVTASAWTSWSEFSISSKFRGKYLQVTPLDISHLEFTDSGHHITWRKVTTTVHNIIVGKLWLDNQGDMSIVNHTTGDKCHLKFIPYSYFSREAPRKVTGVVVDKYGDAKWVLQGTWDGKMEASRVINSHTSSSLKGKPLLETSTPKVLWKKNPLPPGSEKMYNMTLLAIQLNEPEEGVAPTDSRNRPDQRLMEDGNWDEANRVKSLLEDKQRLVRRKKELEAEAAAAAGKPYVPYEPIWFEKIKDPITGNPVHVYKNEYWSSKEIQEWSVCPPIFELKSSPSLEAISSSSQAHAAGASSSSSSALMLSET